MHKLYIVMPHLSVMAKEFLQLFLYDHRKSAVSANP